MPDVNVTRGADGRFIEPTVRTPVVGPLGGTSSVAGPRAVLGRVWAAARGVARWYSAINGGQDYQRYVDHLRRNHPGAPVPSVGDYWRERYAEAERNPTNRCC
ncbi:YbdD/YjiX family protein [Nocardia sp. A7]|uniref:YbdD/YjiX family protein n=1 Tax=Nocardia sp. A7 TaxID=2789274 RepID=UPI00397E301D